MVSSHNIQNFYDKEKGIYTLGLESASCLLLSYLLSPAIPYIFAYRYKPNDMSEWWECPVMLSKKEKLYRLEVKRMEFDFQMSTDEFLDILDEFGKSGIEIFQSNNKIPSTLAIYTINENSLLRVLRHNGITSRFYLPNYHGEATFWTFDKEHFSNILENPAISDRILECNPQICNEKKETSR